MKATKLLLASLLLAGVSTLAFAGPGPQFWAQQAKNQPAAVSSATAKDAISCGQCACCAGMKKS